MENSNTLSKKIILVLVIVLSIIGIAFNSFADTKLYTEGLKKGDVLSFTENGATAWNVYKTKAQAKKTGVNIAFKWITPKDKITILSVAKDCNVLKVKVENEKNSYTGFIHYGSDASRYFKKVEKETQVKSIKLDKTTPINIKKGETATVKASILPKDAKYKKIEVYFWNNEWNNFKTDEMSKTKIMTVKKEVKDGKVTINITGKKAGTATLFVRVINDNNIAVCEASREITITEPVKEVKEIKLNKEKAALDIGKTLTLKATIKPSNATDKTVTWKSLNEKIATVDKDGKVTAIAEGKAVITATSANGKVASCEITVNAKKVIIESVSVKDKNGKTEGSIGINQTIELEAKVIENTGNKENQKMGYLNNDSTIVDLKIVNNKIVLKGLKVGETTIVVRSLIDETKKAEYKVTVTEEKVPVTRVTIKGETKRVSPGATLELTASVLPENANQDVTWESRNEQIAKVDEKGKVTISKDAKSGTSVTIVARSKDNTKKYGLWTIKVIQETITLNATSLKLGAGESFELKAKVTPTGTKVTWESSNTKFANVNENGKVTINNKEILNSNGIKEKDKVTITAKAGNAIATCEIERVPLSVGKMKVKETFDYSTRTDFKKIVQNETPNIVEVQKDGKTIKAKKSGVAKILWQNKNGDYCKTVWYVQIKAYNPALYNGRIYEVNKSVYCDAYTKYGNKEITSGEHYWHLSGGDRFQVLSMDGNWVKIKIVSLTEVSKKKFKEGDTYYIFVSDNTDDKYFTYYAWEQV